MLIIENFIPHEEKNKLMNRAYFDEEEDETWKLQQITKHGYVWIGACLGFTHTKRKRKNWISLKSIWRRRCFTLKKNPKFSFDLCRHLNSTLNFQKLRLHVTSMWPFCLFRLKTGSGAVLWHCLHMALKRSKVPNIKNGDVDGTCKQDLASVLVAMSRSRLSELSLSPEWSLNCNSFYMCL